MDKIDLELVAKHNIWIYALCNTVKSLCWTRVYCRDAKMEAYEARLKAKEEREAEIVKYEEDIVKALETAKAELDEETSMTFNEEEWLANYKTENPCPENFEVEDFKPHLDIE